MPIHSFINQCTIKKESMATYSHSTTYVSVIIYLIFIKIVTIIHIFTGFFWICQNSISLVFSMHIKSICWIIFNLESALYELTSYSTIRLLDKSALFPDKAMTILGLACLCNSLTHVFALPNVSWFVIS